MQFTQTKMRAAATAAAALARPSPHAHHLFDETPHRDLVRTTAAIARLARGHRHGPALALVPPLLRRHRPNDYALSTALRSATAAPAPRFAHQLHALALKLALNRDPFVATSILDHYAKNAAFPLARRALDDAHHPNVVSYTALLNGYLKNGFFDDARKVFDEMPDRNVVSWNAMVSGFSRAGLNEEALYYFVAMLRDGVAPSSSSFPSVLTSVSNIASLGTGRGVHALALKSLPGLDVYVANSLVTFYAKCGSLEDSVLLFEKFEFKNVVSWNAVICGLAQNGRGREAVEFYKKMRGSGVRPNDVSLLGLLFGCNHAGLVDEGYAFFSLARDEQPEILRAEHYACVVDLLARSRRFGEAERFLKELPFEPGIGFWKALLGGSQVHSDKELVDNVAERILKLEPKDTSSYILLSNMYAATGSWQSASLVRREMKEKGVNRIPGCSWIEVRNKVQVFYNGDMRHQMTDQMVMMIKLCLNFYDVEDQCGM